MPNITIDLEKIKRTTQLRGVAQQIMALNIQAKPLTDDTFYQANCDEQVQIQLSKIKNCQEFLAKIGQ